MKGGTLSIHEAAAVALVLIKTSYPLTPLTSDRTHSEEPVLVVQTRVQTTEAQGLPQNGKIRLISEFTQQFYESTSRESCSRRQVMRKWNIIKSPQQSHHNAKVV
jgi:hypothetical protein